MLMLFLTLERFEAELLDAEDAGVRPLGPVGHHGVDLLDGGPGRRLAEHRVVLQVHRGHAGGRGGAAGRAEEAGQRPLVCAESVDIITISQTDTII